MQTSRGLSRIRWTTLRPDLSLPPLLQNTDLFEMIEKMQVRRDPRPFPGAAEGRGGVGVAGPGPWLPLHPAVAGRRWGSVLSRALCPEGRMGAGGPAPSLTLGASLPSTPSSHRAGVSTATPQGVLQTLQDPPVRWEEGQMPGSGQPELCCREGEVSMS